MLRSQKIDLTENHDLGSPPQIVDMTTLGDWATAQTDLQVVKRRLELDKIFGRRYHYNEKFEIFNYAYDCVEDIGNKFPWSGKLITQKKPWLFVDNYYNDSRAAVLSFDNIKRDLFSLR